MRAHDHDAWVHPCHAARKRMKPRAGMPGLHARVSSLAWRSAPQLPHGATRGNRALVTRHAQSVKWLSTRFQHLIKQNTLPSTADAPPTARHRCVRPWLLVLIHSLKRQAQDQAGRNAAHPGTPTPPPPQNTHRPRCPATPLKQQAQDQAGVSGCYSSLPLPRFSRPS
jgi:hypothetical protein